MDKELYFEMLEKKDEEIRDLKGDIYLLKEDLETFINEHNEKNKRNRELYLDMRYMYDAKREEVETLKYKLNKIRELLK